MAQHWKIATLLTYWSKTNHFIWEFSDENNFLFKKGLFLINGHGSKRIWYDMKLNVRGILRAAIAIHPTTSWVNYFMHNLQRLFNDFFHLYLTYVQAKNRIWIEINLTSMSWLLYRFHVSRLELKNCHNSSFINPTRFHQDLLIHKNKYFKSAWSDKNVLLYLNPFLERRVDFVLFISCFTSQLFWQ